ncbi:MAG TPA: preprotein translocase subunit SecG [Patescibacteria group bacterium]|nr:preprotein translocase subunit SecG [Patescibacteria group bacterium]
MFLTILDIIVTVALIIVILLQMQGSGLSSSFGGTGEFYRSRRSLEKFLVWVTVILIVLFGIVSILLLIPR